MLATRGFAAQRTLEWHGRAWVARWLDVYASAVSVECGWLACTRCVMMNLRAFTRVTHRSEGAQSVHSVFWLISPAPDGGWRITLISVCGFMPTENYSTTTYIHTCTLLECYIQAAHVFCGWLKFRILITRFRFAYTVLFEMLDSLGNIHAIF